ncbi:MAG: cardiolipin synthase [Planctomycetota bacterium]
MLYALLTLFEILLVGRVLMRPHRDPSSRIAWIVVVLVLPVFGCIAYLLLGETSLGARRERRLQAIEEALPPYRQTGPVPETTERFELLARVATSISGMPLVGGNSGALMADSNAAIDAMVADIDAAEGTVHLLFYIWLTDGNGTKVVEALKRAAGRGVTCRAIADWLGSRDLIRSKAWGEMREAGVPVAGALRFGNPILRPLQGRLDLRNHRKILVVDHRVTYCGSQNCADPEFRTKPDFAPWVDAVIRFEGPVARQNQRLWAGDWMVNHDEDVRSILETPVESAADGIPAVAFGTGPTARFSAMPEMFESLLYATRREAVITTPYFVPDSALLQALTAAGYRGIDVTIVFPARNDSWIVAAASHSTYAELLRSGVKIREYEGGLLHTKSFTIDDDTTLIGSANMDRRSFELNYENNILFHDRELTAAVRERQEAYLASSREVTLDEVEAWPLTRRLWNNAISMLGPVL